MKALPFPCSATTATAMIESKPPTSHAGVRSIAISSVLSRMAQWVPTIPATMTNPARLTGLTRATVSDLVSDLVGSGLVREMGPGPSSGGKPPTMLSLNPRGRDIVALDLSREPFEGAVVDLSGLIQDRRRAPRRSARGRRGVVQIV